MKIVEFYPEKQGRPYSPPGASLDGRGAGLAPLSVRGIHLAGEFSRTSKTDDYTAGDEMVILADADLRADAILTRLKSETLAGRLVLPYHDCSVELYDKVKVEDVRGY